MVQISIQNDRNWKEICAELNIKTLQRCVGMEG